MQPQRKPANDSVQQWRKLGISFVPDGSLPWMASHASFPKALVLEDRIRLYFATRCAQKRSRIGYVDVDINDPVKVLDVSKDIVLDIGELGAFDDAGVAPSGVVKADDGRVFLYYHGCNPLQLTPYRFDTGLAVSEDNGKTFKRYSNAPIMQRSNEEPIFSNNANVMKEGSTWHMWYMNVARWLIVNDKPEAQHMINYATSKDGINWQRANHTCIPPKEAMECNCNASVKKDGGVYKMWYCWRSAEDFRSGKGAYRMGYAESKDAKNWTRMDELAGLEPSPEGWDSVMAAYPDVVDAGGKRLMFYNGNGFGFTGIGCAVLES